MKGEYGNIWVDVVSANRITSCPNPPFPSLRPRRLPLCHLRALHDALDPGTFRMAANIITEMGHS